MNNNSPCKRNSVKGFSLIEVMITVAIVGILASIALPSYDNYVTRAKLQEGMYYLERAKLAVNIYHQDGGDLSALVNAPATYSTLGLKRSINTDYLDQYWIDPWDKGDDITIWVRTSSSSDLPSNAEGKWPVYLVGNVEGRSIKWVCKSDYHGGNLTKYAPVNCR